MYDFSKTGQLFHTHRTSIIRGAIVILLIISSIRAADFAWLLFEPKVAPDHSVSGYASRAVESAIPVSLTNVDIFEERAQKTAVIKRANTTKAIRKTSLNLALSATMAHEDSKESGAIITIGNKQKMVWVGDKLPMGGSVILQEVEQDRVVLSNNGVPESLVLDKKKDRSFVSSQPTTGTAQSRAKFLKDIQADVAMVPVMTGTQLSGVRLSARTAKTRQFFSKIGLQSNDQIISINGAKVSTRTNLNELTRLLASNNVVALNVKRDGVLKVVEISPSVLSDLE